MATNKTASQLFAEVGLEVAKQKKSATNEGQGFKYVPAEALLGSVNQALFARGFSLESDVTLLSTVETENAKGRKALTAIVKLDITVHAPDRSCSWHASALGQGLDYGDKAVSKAITMAHKYAYTTLFAIAFANEDADAESPTYSGEW